MVKVNTNLTNYLRNCLTKYSVVAGIHFNNSNEVRLPSDTTNYIKDAVVTHISGFICSDTDIFVTEETFQCRKVRFE